jgi:hypothetical protein
MAATPGAGGKAGRAEAGPARVTYLFAAIIWRTGHLSQDQGFHIISERERAMKRPKSARAEAEDRLFDWFENLVSAPGDDGIIGFATHIGIHLSTDDQGRSWWPLFLARYTVGKSIDEERFAYDLATFPPIACRIAELRAERAKGKQHGATRGPRSADTDQLPHCRRETAEA